MPRPAVGSGLARHSTLIAKDGTERSIIDSAAPIRDTDGTTLGVVLVFRDVTEQRQAEAEVERLHREVNDRADYLQALMDILPVGVAVAHDPDCRTITINPGFAELLGLPDGLNVSRTGPKAQAPDAILRNAREVDPAELPMHVAAARKAKVSGQEVDVRLADGRLIHLLVNAVPLLDGDGQVKGSLGVHVDITGRKRAEEARERAKEAAETASRYKDRFLAALSHELRTPLTPALLTVSALEGDPKLHPDLRDDIRTVRRNVELEARLIDDLLDLTRISRGRIDLKAETADVHSLIHHAVNICRADSKRRG